MPADAALVGALHVEYLKKRDLVGKDRPHHTLFQASTIEALLEGKYDGDASFDELGERGAFGLGTLDALDGEMVALDGGFFQIKSDGRAYEIDGRSRTTFVVVTFLEPGPPRTLPAPLDFAGLCAYVDRIVGETAGCCAVRVDGRFERVKTRSLPRQRRPYPPLVEVVEGRPTFELRDVRGSLVGFRFPDHTGGLNVPGYHFHFVTDDRRAGGHVLACRMTRGELRVDREADPRLELPPEVPLPVPGRAASGREALNRVERER